MSSGASFGPGLRRIREPGLQRGSTWLLLCVLLAGCTAAPSGVRRLPKSAELGPDRVVAILIDTCIEELTLAGQDYFAIAESRAGADALLKATLVQMPADVGVGAKLIPFVCGVRHQGATSERIADHVDAAITVAQQPFDLSSEIASDPDYARALSTASTYMFEHAPFDAKTGEAAGTTAGTVSDSAFRDALAVISARTQASSLLYVGVFGTSISHEMAVTLGVARFMVGMTTGIITAGMLHATAIGIVPGQKVDGRVMAASLVDLRGGRIVRSNAVRADGDPIKPEVISNANMLDLLLKDAIFQPNAAFKF